MSFKNEAAWQTAKNVPLQVGPAEVVLPGADQILIKNQAWAINPVDWKMQEIGMFIESYPAIFGVDLAGEVAAVGDEVTKFKIGDRVAAVPIGAITKKTSETAFQLYTTVPARCAIPIPDSIPYEEAVKLPLAFLTATAGLYEKMHLSLPFPSLKLDPANRTLLVWGGSSNVGSAAIQLAVSSGFEVVATASKRQHALVKQIGASKVFDYNSPDLVEELVEQLQGTSVAGVFDAIGTADTTTAAARVLERLGGGKIASTLPPSGYFPNSVEVKQVQALSVFLSEPGVGKAVWENFAPEALKSGRVRPMTETRVIGRGLDSIQAGLDEVKKGVSGVKVVVLA